MRCLRMLSLILFVFPLPLPTMLAGRDLDKPKSHNLTLQLESMRMLAGLISLCMMLALCRNLMPHNKLYKIQITCASCRQILGYQWIIFLRSLSTYSMTINIPNMGSLIGRSVVKMSMSSATWLLPMEDSYLQILISLSTFTQSYSFLKIPWMNFIATDLLVNLQVASTTCPQLPKPKSFSILKNFKAPYHMLFNLRTFSF